VGEQFFDSHYIIGRQKCFTFCIYWQDELIHKGRHW